MNYERLFEKGLIFCVVVQKVVVLRVLMSDSLGIIEIKVINLNNRSIGYI
jgi:hypothetical protein